MLEALVHYFSPDHIQGTVVAILAVLAASGAGIVAIAKATVTRSEVTSEADDQNDEIRDTTISLLRQQNDLLRQQNAELEKSNEEVRGSVGYLTETVTNLTAKVDNLSMWLEAMACLNAPTCANRECPTRDLIFQMIEGQITKEEVAEMEPKSPSE